MDVPIVSFEFCEPSELLSNFATRDAINHSYSFTVLALARSKTKSAAVFPYDKAFCLM